MIREITQEEIDRENGELFNEDKIRISMEESIVLGNESDAWSEFTKYCAWTKCNGMLERKVLVALSAIVSVKDGMLVASVGERDKRLITTCLGITNKEYKEAIGELEEHNLIVGTSGDDVLVSELPSLCTPRSSKQLIRLDVLSEIEHGDGETHTKYSTSVLTYSDDD